MSQESDVFLIDDDGELVISLARALSPKISPLTLRGCSVISEAISLVAVVSPKVVVLDLCLDEQRGVESGFDALQKIRALNSSARVVVLTGHGSSEHGVRALMLGASSFIEKPVDPSHLAAVVKDAAMQADLRRAYEALARSSSSGRFHDFVGKSTAAQKVRDQLAFAAATRQPILLSGETGTGKGLCARIIHDATRDMTGRFVHYQPNFGGGDLVQSELFGHTRGAFTGATESRLGLVCEAQNGTLFLDELDELPAEVQVRLLDLVQERRVRPVGSDAFTNVSCRFIAATNRPLGDALAQGKIRRDLYHRLAHAIVAIPPLRDRLEDVSDLCDAALEHVRSRCGVPVFSVGEPAMKKLLSYSWPGNVRELYAVIEGGAYRAHYDGRSSVENDDIHIGFSTAEGAGAQTLHDRVAALKVSIVEDAMRQHGGNQVQAAKSLGLDRGTLRRILERVEGR